jgi:hypothetical protein
VIIIIPSCSRAYSSAFFIFLSLLPSKAKEAQDKKDCVFVEVLFMLQVNRDTV